MRPARRGKIINIASIGGRRGAKNRSAYRASKAALINLTESIAAEERAHGIDVNCICPGAVDTEGFRAANGEAAVDDKVMGPSQIADVALFLASPRSAAITGTAIDAFGPSNPLF
jgi:NAD(P)-dependent dehydrogenase (short-subunit alcohol dehydrogenase family)